jgi:glutathione S-transferase
MKILQTKTAPNPRRVRVFLAEKGIEVPYEELDLMQGALKTPEFTSLNRFQRVPVLVLDDGTAIAETMAICRYFEETKPEPALLGKGAKQRAVIEMWNRRMELGLLFSVAQAFRHLHPAAAPLEVPQVAAWGEANKPRALEILQFMDEELGKRPLHRRRGLFGGRHHGAGGGRFREGGQDSAVRGPQEPGALARGGLGPAKRQGLNVGACYLGNRQAGPIVISPS